MKALIILSGGIDSTTLLYDIVKQYGADNITALSFNYGSKHNGLELPRAAESCGKLKVKHLIWDINDIFKGFDSALLKGGEKIPKGHYGDENMKKTVVPFRNGILLSIAIGMAENLKMNKVFYGAHGGDHAIYPDCRKSFVRAINKAGKLGTYNRISVTAPYLKMNKTEIIRKGTKLNVDYGCTWTCYDPTKDKQPCGKCGSCVERTQSFWLNEIQDPLYNDVQWQKAIEYMLEVSL